MSKRNRLGKGLGALFTESGEASEIKGATAQDNLSDAGHAEAERTAEGTAAEANRTAEGTAAEANRTAEELAGEAERSAEGTAAEPGRTAAESTVEAFRSAGESTLESEETSVGGNTEKSVVEPNKETTQHIPEASAEETFELSNGKQKTKSASQEEKAENQPGMADSRSQGRTSEGRTSGRKFRSKKSEPEDGRVYVSVALIDASGDQPRQEFDAEELAQLAESIKNYGILQPLLVTKKDERYEIIAGERRFRAAKMVGLQKIPVVIGEYSKQESMEVQLIENIQRSDLNPIEEAKAYQKLIQEFGLKQEELAKRVSKNRVTIANSMRLLRLDEQVQVMLAAGNLSAGHARALLAVKDQEKQRDLAEKIVSNDLSVRQIEKIVKKMAEEEEHPAEEEKNPEEEKIAIFYQDLADHLKQVMGTKVQIRRKDENRGKIEIEYYSPEELERITELLQSIHSDPGQ